MLDISNLAPELAGLFGVNPATLVLLLVILNRGCELAARVIPNDATGWRATVRKIAAVIGTYTPNRITSAIPARNAADAALVPSQNSTQTEGAK